MRIAVIGTGYVGLVAGACLADFGHSVSCVDRDLEKIAALSRGEVPIYENGLRELISANVAAGRLAFTTDAAAAAGEADVVFISVGTPTRSADGRVDLSDTFRVAREIAPALQGFTVVATKSTVPVGTGDELVRVIREANAAADFAVVSNPEFLREGAAINDFKLPDRIIIGTDGDARAEQVMSAVYRPLHLNQAPILFTSRRTAELTKYAANAFLAMKITFANEMADLCEQVGADVQDLARGVGLDNRIGTKFLHAGPGYDGSCLPKDAAALIRTARDHGRPLRLVEATVAVNDERKADMAGRIVAACGGDVQAKTIAVLGLTFKPRTDDMREAPSLAIIRLLHEGGATIRAFDPAGMDGARRLLADVTFAGSAYEAAEAQTRSSS